MPSSFLLLVLVLLSLLATTSSAATDTIAATEILTTNNTLTSQSKTFVLGFFQASNSHYYLGIWYYSIYPRTIVWVANRDNPIDNSTGYLQLDPTGNILLFNSTAHQTWSSSNLTAPPKSPILHLLDSGNLVVTESNDSTNFLWQSFDYPTDTLLPGMKMGLDFQSGTDKHLTSWKLTGQDPSTGDYSFKIDPRGSPEVFLRRDDSIIYRSGPWNGDRFSGVPEMSPDTDSIVFTFSDDDPRGVFYSFSIGNRSLFSRLTVTSDSDGELQRLTWIESSQTWTKFWYAPKDQCDDYLACGAYSFCDSNTSPVCNCMDGFRPKNPPAWNLRDGSDGCVRNTRLDCVTDGFVRLQHVKLPETTTVFVNKSMGIDECEALCKRNCSCSGYANIDVTNGGSGCVTWVGELVDIRRYSEGGQDLFVRIAASDLGSAGGSNKSKHTGQAVGITLSAAVIVLGFGTLCYLRKKRKQRERIASLPRNRDLIMNEVRISSIRGHSGERDMDELELPMFDFNTLTMATNNFSEANKLGQGGFGSVYRGILIEGQEIAVKRLSKASGQGVEEFKNELKLIVKLQHRNLVRLLGCCVEMDEKMLVYEYMENRSLDSFLFDKAKRSILDWTRRYHIICGIARGLLYLHQDSRFRIIHRDLKASNILLDGEMNPKISDFGMARIFGKDQEEANTLRVVGTYGYMSPEYAMDGNFSVKSDVFSFGVLVLEIITGKKNRGFYYTNDELNLLGNAWRQWNEGTALELIDSSISKAYSQSEVLRCIHIGLLCVQERPEDRPTMSSVVLMLSSEATLLPQPRNPGFSLGRKPTETDSSSSKQDESHSVNRVTITLLDAR